MTKSKTDPHVYTARQTGMDFSQNPKFRSNKLAQANAEKADTSYFKRSPTVINKSDQQASFRFKMPHTT
jgi:hypothetical protein